MPVALMMFLQTYWKPIAAVSAVLALVASFGIHGAYKHHQGYKEGLAEGEAKYQIEVKAHRDDIRIWEGKIQAVKDENKKEIDRLNLIVKQNFEDYLLSKKKTEQTTKVIYREIQANIRPTDTIVVPNSFARLYQYAVCTGPGQQCDGNQEAGKENSSRLVEESTTFAAVAFSQVVINNVVEYNKLALQCNALIDIVKEQQDGYDPNGTDGKDVPTGRNGGSGTLGPE